jgi:hypothetical protein
MFIPGTQGNIMSASRAIVTLRRGAIRLIAKRFPACGRWTWPRGAICHRLPQTHFRTGAWRSSDRDGGGDRQRCGPREKEPRASTTDAPARFMKMADGGFRPAHNVQFDTDTKSTDIAGVSVDNSDMGKISPMNDALAR